MSTPQDMGAAALAAALASRAAQQTIQIPQPQLNLPRETKMDLLRKMRTSFETHHRFEPGQLVTWKPGMQTRPYPMVGDPAIVLQILAEPIFDGTSDASFPSFREPLDIVVGCLGPQAQFLTFYLPSVRFEPFTA